MKLTGNLMELTTVCAFGVGVKAQSRVSKDEVLETMFNATQFMVDSVSASSGYVWYYMPDFSRQWDEKETYKTMVWLQHLREGEYIKPTDEYAIAFVGGKTDTSPYRNTTDRNTYQQGLI